MTCAPRTCDAQERGYLRRAKKGNVEHKNRKFSKIACRKEMGRSRGTDNVKQRNIYAGLKKEISIAQAFQ
jgi:hypothetical protein